MPKTFRLLLIVFCLGTIVFAPLGCSDDDDPTTPTGPVDSTAPLVVDINPGDRSMGVPLSEPVTIVFSEPMDPATADGQVTLDSGANPVLAWNTGNTILTVAHDAWAEGTAVEVTVGTGLTDAAGNALPQAFGSRFYTTSPRPVVLDIMLPGGADAMERSGIPVFLFSEGMELLSIYENTTVTQAPIAKAVPEFRVGTVAGDYRAVEIEFLAPLDALATYTITIGSDAETRGGTALGAPVVTTFTTGADVDETGPQILSVSPAIDAVAPVDLATITVTFTEPIATPDLYPDAMSALLEMFMMREPVWNADRDELTLYLQGPLPAGVRLFTIFDVESFTDLSGNYNAEPDSLSFTTAGTATYFPVREDLRIYYHYSESSKAEDSVVRQTVANIDGEEFDRVLTPRTATGFDGEQEVWRMAQDADGLYLVGLEMDGSPVTFTPPLPLLELPAERRWSGSVAASDGEVSFTLAYSAESSPLYDERYYGGYGKAGPGGPILENCIDVEVEYTMTIDGETLPFERGALYFYLTPGLGFYGMEQYGQEFDGETLVDEWEDEHYLIGAALDDRYELIR